MPKLGADELALIVVVIVGAAVAFVTRYAWTSRATTPMAVALAVIWALASLAVAWLSGRKAVLSIPALATFVLSIAALVVVQLQHRRLFPFALATAALSVVLVRAAIRFDRKVRP